MGKLTGPALVAQSSALKAKAAYQRARGKVITAGQWAEFWRWVERRVEQDIRSIAVVLRTAHGDDAAVIQHRLFQTLYWLQRDLGEDAEEAGRRIGVWGYLPGNQEQDTETEEEESDDEQE